MLNNKDLPHCGGRICAPIAREQETIIKRCVRADGQYSATDYLVRKRLGDLSLVDFFLETGRTHQISTLCFYGLSAPG